MIYYKALELISPRQFKLSGQNLREIPLGAIAARVLGCAICGTDLKIYRGDKQIPSRILGHEFVAEILEVGQGVDAFKLGDRVALATTVSCGYCWYCLEGITNLCDNAIRVSIDQPGAFAEVVVIPALAVQRGNVLKVPESLDDLLAVLIEPLSCVVNGQQIAKMSAGKNVLVVGSGPMGLLHVQLARHLGAKRIILSEINPARLKQAEKFAVDVVVNPLNENLVERVKAETDGRGADLAIVCSSTARAIEGLTDAMNKRGTLSLFAGLGAEDKKVLLDGRAIHYRELKVTGASDSRPEHFALAMRILEAYPESFNPLITHTFGLEQAKEAFEVLEKGEGLKVVFVPGGKR